MKRKIVKALVVIIVVTVFVSVLILGQYYKKDVGIVEYPNSHSKIFGEFAADTSAYLLSNKDENTCYSPLSMFAALSLTAKITEDATHQEILKGLGVKSIEDLEEHYKKMLESIDVDSKNSKITLANSFWTTNTSINGEIDDIIKNINDTLECEVFLKDEAKPAEVNEWVNEKTEGMIEKIIEEETEYSFLLANTLYYKSKWMSSMDKMGSKQSFYGENGDVSKVYYLEAEQLKLKYKQTRDYTYVEVPLMEGTAIFVLPKEESKLKNLLNEKTINNIIATSASENGKEEGVVHIKVPEYTIEYGFNSEDIEKVLGKREIKSLFESPDWVNGLLGTQTDLIQKTKFDLNEEGIEAAAVTTVMGVYGVKEKEDIDLEITFNRPFMYVLMKDGVPLFIGTVYNPAE